MRRPADQHPLLVLKVKVEAQVHQVLDACDRLDELVLAALCGFAPGLERRLLLGEGTHFLVEGRFGHDSSFILMFRKASFRSEEHTSELQSIMRISYAVFCLKT